MISGGVLAGHNAVILHKGLDEIAGIAALGLTLDNARSKRRASGGRT